MLISQAADLLDRAIYTPGQLGAYSQAPHSEARAYMADDRVMLIPGSDGDGDWMNFNLQMAVIEARATNQDLHDSAEGVRWHRGFFLHAQLLLAWAMQQRPSLIVGHSLGGASAQIVGWYLQVPTLTFGAPRPQHGREALAGEGIILNVGNAMDTVFDLPSRRFSHVGHTLTLPGPADGLVRHSMRDYIGLLERQDNRLRLPERWPSQAIRRTIDRRWLVSLGRSMPADRSGHPR